ncbi:hypothetical protein WJ01_01190 [Burkholderia vietnamiensis]|nr:hypothetical protein WJ01_01190 [Burkholderia vietnamiensis]
MADSIDDALIGRQANQQVREITKVAKTTHRKISCPHVRCGLFLQLAVRGKTKFLGDWRARRQDGQCDLACGKRVAKI